MKLFLSLLSLLVPACSLLAQTSARFNNPTVASNGHRPFVHTMLNAKQPVRQENPAVRAISFIENKGQIVDAGGKPHPEILFTSRDKGVQLYLGHNSIFYTFRKIQNLDSVKAGPFGLNEPKHPLTIAAPAPAVTRRFELRLDNANPQAKIIKEVEASYYERYYLPQCPNGITARSFQKVVYKDIYDGIDWVLHYTNTGRLKYDFVVHPGADPQQIRLRVTGADIRIDETGQLRMDTELGNVTEDAPVSFAGEQRIITHFKNAGDNTIGFDLGSYDRTRELVIDPSVSWATYFGGSGFEGSTGCATDAAGNVYMTGYSHSSDFPVTNALQSTIGSSDGDVFITKFNNAGSVLWSTYYGGNGGDGAFNCTTDRSGKIYVVGSTGSSNFPLKNPLQTTFTGGLEAFILKLDTNGTSIWATYLGGSDIEDATACATDGAGNVFVTGSTYSTNFPVKNAVQSGIALGDCPYPDPYVTKFSSNGTMLWSTYYGGTDVDGAMSCCADSSGAVYIAGNTMSTDFPVANAAQPNYSKLMPGGPYDAFLTKFSASGSVLWSTYWGGTNGEGVSGCAVNRTGGVYLTGSTNSTNFPTSNAIQNSLVGSSNSFVTRFSNSGSVLWSTYHGNGLTGARGCASDASGNIYFSGLTDSYTFPSVNSLQPFGGLYDLILVKLNDSGKLVFSSCYGASGGEEGSNCAIDTMGNLFLTGIAYSSLFPTHNAVQSNYGGSKDAYLVKINTSTCAPVISVSVSPNDTVCAGTNVTFTANATNTGAAPVYQWKKNGVSVGTNSPAFSTSGLADGDTIVCEVTSSLACAYGSFGSMPWLMTVKPYVSPAVAINASPGNFTCSGTPNLFNAIVINGGSAPAYQWKKNGVNVGTGSISYTDAGLSAGDIISCEISSNALCLTNLQASDSTTMVAGSNMIPSVALSSTGDSICENTVVSFTASPTYGGTAPIYQWKKNSINVGGNSPGYSDGNLSDGDTIGVVLISNASCVSPTANTASAPVVVMKVTPLAVPAIDVNVFPSTVVCIGTPVLFESIVAGGGSTPTYQWYKNKVEIIDATNATYFDSSLLNGDTISVVLVTSEACAAFPSVSSDKVGLHVPLTITPTVAIMATHSGILPKGTRITFISAQRGGGPNPSFQWQKNGIDIPFATASTYSSDMLANGDSISVTMLSSEQCANPLKASSNAMVVEMQAQGVNGYPGAWPSHVRVYPNPSNGHIVIVVEWPDSALDKEVTIELFNVLGQRVYQNIVHPNQRNWSCDVWVKESTADGTYLLKLGSEAGEVVTMPITLKH